MRELLRSHEQDIVDRVVDQLSFRNHSLPSPALPSPTLPSPRVSQYSHRGGPPPSATSILAKISQLEAQLAELRSANSQEPIVTQLRGHGTLNPTHTATSILGEGDSPSGIVDSVETLFPGVERNTLVQIIENRFKPTNIYRLLASEKERAETNRTINIGGMEFEQNERDGKESDDRMSTFFKACTAYCGILIKLAPYGLQGELATALCIYTMNLYDLLEKYTWDGVKAYHFQFHRKRVASGKSIYQPGEWQQLDSQLIASKCFAHPAPRPTWNQTQKPALIPTRRTDELPIRESLPPRPEHPSSYPTPTQSQLTLPATSMALIPATAQPCRNWNFRDCKLT